MSNTDYHKELGEIALWLDESAGSCKTAATIIDCMISEYEDMRIELAKLQELYDNACAKLRLPGTDNDGGPGDIAEDVECMLHNSNVAWEMVATSERDLARANDIIDFLLRRCMELENIDRAADDYLKEQKHGPTQVS